MGNELGKKFIPFDEFTRDGEYQYRPDIDLSKGKYFIEVEVIDSAGNINRNDLHFNIDSPPNEPVIELDISSDTSRIKDGKEKWTSRKKPKFIIDTREDEDAVKKAWVTVTDINGQPKVFEAQRAPDRTFYFIPDDPGNGRYTFSVQTENSRGEKSAPSKECVVHVDSDKPATPGISTADLMARDGLYFTKDKEVRFLLTDIDPQTDPASIEIFFVIGDKKIQAELFKDEDHFYFKAPKDMLLDGEYRIEVRIENNASTWSETARLEFTVDTSVPPRPEIVFESHDFVKDLHHNDVVKADKKELPTFYFNVQGNVKPEDLMIELDGQEITGELKHLQGNQWSWTPHSSLVAGEHTFSVTLSRLSGNTSEAKRSFRVLPELDSPTIEITNITSLDPDAHPNLTKDNKVSFTIRPNGIAIEDIKEIWVKLSVNGVEGRWEKIPFESWDKMAIYTTEALPDGDHSIDFKFMDISDKESTSTTQEFKVKSHMDPPEFDLFEGDYIGQGEKRETQNLVMYSIG